MSVKFAWRTIRNIVFRNRPYFAHLALTHRCNLRCRFCRIQEERFAELDTDGMKRVIDRLDRMGVGVLSISGGGEPLLRPDFATILDYAASRGLYTKITSNGTMPLSKYDELLRSRVDEIGISVDGVDGNDLPFSHVGPRILQTIGYLNSHLAARQKLTLNVTVSEANCDDVDRIVAHCTREYPRARIWLNPVVRGDGRLRNGSDGRVKPDYLKRCQSPTLLRARFYTEGVFEQYRNGKFEWGCRAGRMFFDVKPNGDVWLCQDKPARTPLNILDPDFMTRFSKLDVGNRRECSGCTYSCYFLTQKGFEPSNWRDMAVLWWTSATDPDAPCRQVAEERGWVAGLLSFASSRLKAAAIKPVTALLLASMSVAGLAEARAQAPSRSADEIVERMERHNEARLHNLASYECERRYTAGNLRFGRHAEVTAVMRFEAPGAKTFEITRRQGSKTIQRKAIEPVMEAERSTAGVEARSRVDLCRRNYRFHYGGFDDRRKAHVFEVEPLVKSRYLFRGRIWVNADSYAIQRAEGEPAQSPSFWVLRTRFVHEYAQFGNYWFPIRHHTDVDLRIFGRSTLDIEYSMYQWRSSETADSDELAARTGSALP